MAYSGLILDPELETGTPTRSLEGALSFWVWDVSDNKEEE